MFSANENLLLREHKKRVVRYVEDTIPEEALDMGTSVMVMQTTCRTPGCVPLETAIAIVFPRGGAAQKQWIDGLKESSGGTFKTRILMPLADVNKDDVLDALPPGFEGGRKTWERTCLAARDIVLGRIGGLVGSGDTDIEVEERRTLAEYLRHSLDDYLNAGCIAPELGMPFPTGDTNSSLPGTGTSNHNVVKGAMEGSGNFVIRRGDDETDTAGTSNVGKLKELSTQSTNMTTVVPKEQSSRNEASKNTGNAMDWRRRQNISNSLQLPSSDSMIQRLSEREHAPGVRSPGCPCCDPDNMTNILDGMML